MGKVPGINAVFTHAIQDGVLCIFDLDEAGHKSVTNDIEYVIVRLRTAGVDTTLPIIYRDSEGEWTGVKLRNLRFSPFEHFVHLHDKAVTLSQKVAVQCALTLRAEGQL